MRSRLRHIALASAVILAPIIAACSSSNEATNPATDPFTGSYVLSTLAGVSLPRHVDTNLTTGGYDILESGSLSFPDQGHIIVSFSMIHHDSATTPPVTLSQTDTYTLGRLPTQAFLMSQTSAGDTVASIIVPAASQLALNYHIANGPGTYLFVRP
ncbi:MAG TPA: hypothetical protein VGM67_14310 [Gemmatimonadaceae bacterium]|jgi:hypothetical protein